jgi:hypothetical protein
LNAADNTREGTAPSSMVRWIRLLYVGLRLSAQNINSEPVSTLRTPDQSALFMHRDLVGIGGHQHGLLLLVLPWLSNSMSLHGSSVTSYLLLCSLPPMSIDFWFLFYKRESVWLDSH